MDFYYLFSLGNRHPVLRLHPWHIHGHVDICCSDRVLFCHIFQRVLVLLDIWDVHKLLKKMNSIIARLILSSGIRDTCPSPTANTQCSEPRGFSTLYIDVYTYVRRKRPPFLSLWGRILAPISLQAWNNDLLDWLASIIQLACRLKTSLFENFIEDHFKMYRNHNHFCFS